MTAPTTPTQPVSQKSALVVGLGVTGMAAALSLHKAGWRVQVIERAAERRTGGYFIGLSKEAFDAARDLGVDAFLRTHTPQGNVTWEVDSAGKRRRSLSFTDQPNHPEVVLRGDIEEALWEGMRRDEIPVRFSTTPTQIASNTEQACVLLRDASTGDEQWENFDLVVGCDGVRSTTRRLVFGPDDEFTKPMNRIICAFQLSECPPATKAQDGVIVAEEKRSLWVFPFSDEPPTALFTYVPQDVDDEFTIPPKQALERAYRGMSGDGVVPWALQQFDHADNYLFDSVLKVQMPRWRHNRVVLAGDAAWCLTLYSGYGATAGFYGGWKLGQQLAREADLETALDTWESEMRSYVKGKGGPTKLKAEAFVPSNAFAYTLRNALLTHGTVAHAMRRWQWRQRVRSRILHHLFGEKAHDFPLMPQDK